MIPSHANTKARIEGNSDFHKKTQNISNIKFQEIYSFFLNFLLNLGRRDYFFKIGSFLPQFLILLVRSVILFYSILFYFIDFLVISFFTIYFSI